jgi:hypothetical protein
MDFWIVFVWFIGIDIFITIRIRIHVFSKVIIISAYIIDMILHITIINLS